MTEIGSIELIAKIDTGRYKKGADEINRANEQIEGTTDRADRKQRTFGSTLASVAKKGLKYAVAGFAALATTIGGLVIGGGISRALNIEDAQAKLKGLGHDAKSITKIMKSALKSVKGTAFGLDAAATIAAGAVAAGIKPGKELTKYLALTADAATIAGSSLDEMGSVLNRVQTGQKAYTEDLNMLADRGIPIYQWLQKEFGVTASALRKMVSDGEVDSATYFKVIQDNIGGAALESGATTRGSWKNLLAAMSRLGAQIVQGPIQNVRVGFGEMTKWIDDNANTIVGTIQKMADTVSSIIAGVSKVISGVTDKATGGDFESIGNSMGTGLADALNKAIGAIAVTSESVKKWFDGIDWGKLGLDIGKQAVAFVIGFAIGLLNFDVASAWKVLADNWLAALVGVLSVIFLPSKLAAPIGKMLSKLPFGKIISNFIIKPLRSFFVPIRAAFGDLFGGIGGVIGKTLSNIGNVFKTFFQLLITPARVFVEGVATQIRFIPFHFTNVINGIKNLITGFFGFIGTIFRSIVNVIQVTVRPLVAFFQGLARGIQQPFQSVPAYFTMRFLSARLAVEAAFMKIVTFATGTWVKITNIFSRVGNWFSGKFTEAVNGIKRAFSSVTGFFQGLWRSIVSIFGRVGTSIGNAIGNSFKKIINSVIRDAARIINGFIDAINGAIDIINKIPKVNLGKLEKMPIPQLATGGIVSSATLAVIGEGSEPEAVIPLSKLDKMLANAGSSDGGGRNMKIEQNIYPQNDLDLEAASRKLAYQIGRY